MILEYKYDDVGNITKEKRTDTSVTPNVVKEITYEYDKLGQLTRVNDPFDITAGENGTTWRYVYDLGGNILSKSYYAFTTGTVGAAVGTNIYAYGDANWKDKLTSYKIGTAAAVPITYDAIGNPLVYNDWTYTWEKGRQLRKMLKGTEQTVVNAQGKSVQKLVSGERVEFAYDAAGLRVQKKHSKVTAVGNPTTVQVVTTDYFLHGKLVMHLKKTTTTETVDANGNVTESAPAIDQMHFFYDTQSRPAMVNFNGTLYTYVHNLQGDIVASVDSVGSKEVEYKYDAWGNPLTGFPIGTLKDTLGKLNPFRYRGYVYDEETSLYYLRSRYYNPEWGKFLNGDSQLGKSGSVLDHNLFAYCKNNSVIFNDHSGKNATLAGDIFKSSWAIGGAVALGDSPIPGPADLVGLVIGVGGTLVAGGVLGWSAVTTTTAVQDHVIEGTETSKKEDSPERRPYCMAAALGDKPPMPIGPTLTINEAEALIIASITAEGAKGIMRPHKSLNVDNARIHVGVFSETRDDAVALQKRFASTLIGDIAEKGKIIMPHMHIARQGIYKKIHIWYKAF